MRDCHDPLDQVPAGAPRKKASEAPTVARTQVRCPNALCSKLNPRQEMMDPMTLERAGLSGNWIWRAHRCTYCHIVYSIDRRRRKVQRGWYDEDGWRFLPALRAKRPRGKDHHHDGQALRRRAG